MPFITEVKELVDVDLDLDDFEEVPEVEVEVGLFIGLRIVRRGLPPQSKVRSDEGEVEPGDIELFLDDGDKPRLFIRLARESIPGLFSLFSGENKMAF